MFSFIKKIFKKRQGSRERGSRGIFRWGFFLGLTQSKICVSPAFFSLTI